MAHQEKIISEEPFGGQSPKPPPRPPREERDTVLDLAEEQFDKLKDGFTVDAEEQRLYDRRKAYYAVDAPALSCRGRILGVIRMLWGYFFAQATLLGFAIAIVVVFKVSYLIARSNQKGNFDSATVAWVVFLPFIMITFAMLIEDGITVVLDTLKHSPFDELNSLNKNIRQKFIYLVVGGERPILLEFRAALVAITTALLVRPVHRLKTEPLIIPPDWIVLVSEAVFYISFFIIPIIYTFVFVQIGTLEYRFFWLK